MAGIEPYLQNMQRAHSANPRITWLISQLGGGQAVAKAIGISPAGVSRWTDPAYAPGPRRIAGVPPIEHLMRLVALARQDEKLGDVTIDWLVDGHKLETKNAGPETS